MEDSTVEAKALNLHMLPGSKRKQNHVCGSRISPFEKFRDIKITIAGIGEELQEQENTQTVICSAYEYIRAKKSL